MLLDPQPEFSGLSTDEQPKREPCPNKLFVAWFPNEMSETDVRSMVADAAMKAIGKNATLINVRAGKDGGYGAEVYTSTPDEARRVRDALHGLVVREGDGFMVRAKMDGVVNFPPFPPPVPAKEPKAPEAPPTTPNETPAPVEVPVTVAPDTPADPVADLASEPAVAESAPPAEAVTVEQAGDDSATPPTTDAAVNEEEEAAIT